MLDLIKVRHEVSLDPIIGHVCDLLPRLGSLDMCIFLEFYDNFLEVKLD